MTFNPTLHGLGKRFLHAEWSTVDEDLFSTVVDYAKHGKKWLLDGRGFLLSGKPGIGKTHTTVALMREWYDKPIQPRFDFYVVTAPRLFELYDFRTKSLAPQGLSWTKYFETVPGLVLNDLGKEDRSKDWLRETVNVRLGRLLRERHEAQLPVYITTNLALNGEDVETVQSTYGDSIWSLMYDLTAFRVQIDAEDKRKTRAQELWNGRRKTENGARTSTHSGVRKPGS